MKLTILGKQYSLLFLGSEDVVVKTYLFGLIKIVRNKMIVYVYDREKVIYKFLTDQVERYD